MKYTILLVFSLVSITVTFGCKDTVKETESSDENQSNNRFTRLIADAAKPVPAKQFNLLTQVQDYGLALAERDGKLAISGVVTSLRWEKYEPTVFEAVDDLYVVLFYTGQEGDMILWDGITNNHHPLPDRLFPIGEAPDYIIIEHNQGWPIISTINPRTRQLEELWCRPAIPSKPMLPDHKGSMEPPLPTIICPIGMDQETMYFAMLDDQAISPFVINRRVRHILSLDPEEPAKIISLPASYLIAGHDAIREGRLLLSQFISAPPVEYGYVPAVPPVYEVSYWDITTESIKKLGEIDGYWYVWPTGRFQLGPSIHLEWIEEARFIDGANKQQTYYPARRASYVVEETLQLYPMPLKHWPREARDAMLHPKPRYELLSF